jgi:hypothetical protein
LQVFVKLNYGNALLTFCCWATGLDSIETIKSGWNTPGRFLAGEFGKYEMKQRETLRTYFAVLTP